MNQLTSYSTGQTIVVYEEPDTYFSTLEVAAAGPTNLTLRFNGTVDNFNPVVSHRIACARADGAQGVWKSNIVVWPALQEAQLTGLDPGTEYLCSLQATNDAGAGLYHEFSSAFWTGIKGNLYIEISGSPPPLFYEESAGNGLQMGVSYSIVTGIANDGGGKLGPAGAVLTLQVLGGGCVVSADNSTYASSSEIAILEGSLTGAGFIKCDTLFSYGDGPYLQLSQSVSDEVGFLLHLLRSFADLRSICAPVFQVNLLATFPDFNEGIWNERRVVVYREPDASSAMLAMVGATPISLKIQFNGTVDNNNPIEYHIIKCQLSSGSGPLQSVVVLMPAQEAEVSPLDPGAEYSCYLAAKNDAGEGLSGPAATFWTGVAGSLFFSIDGAQSYNLESSGGGVQRGMTYAVHSSILNDSGGEVGPPGALLTLETSSGCSVSADNSTFSLVADILVQQGSLDGAVAFLRCDSLYGELVGPTLRISQSASDQVTRSLLDLPMFMLFRSLLY